MSSSRIKSDEIQMGDNYVLPIEQTRVTRQQAKVQQIIDETDAKARQIIDNAETKSQVVIQAANTEAESIIANAKKKAEQEYDKIKEQGLRKVSRTAYISFKTMLKRLLNRWIHFLQARMRLRKISLTQLRVILWIL